MAPEVIGNRYRVKSVIGHGGMGSVWLCTDEILGRDVAVKQVGLLPHESATSSARALREARSSATLNHRNVVSVFDVLDEDGSLWMVMEYVPSRTLGRLVREEGPLPAERVAAIGAQVAAGLAAAHAVGTIHRDVKPDNILITEDGTAKIGDFGIARMHGDEPLTQSGFVTGTPSYFAPELAEGRDPGPAADVWALGATLYTAVEGAPPYPPQNNPVAMLRQIATEAPAPPRRAGVLEPVLKRMLDRDPTSRWGMPDAAHALRRLAERHAPDRTRENTSALPVPPRASGASAAERSTAPHPAPVPPDRGTGRDERRLRVLPLLAGVAVLLLVAGLGYLLLGLGSAPDGGRAAAGATRATSSGSPSGSPSPSESSPSSASTPTTGRAAMTRFLRGYYGTVPGNLDAGWAKLGPHEKQQGRASYDRFWGGVDSVDIGDVRTDPAASSAEVTLTYHFSDGRVVDERQRLDLVRSAGGGYLIDDDTVLSSHTR